MKPELTLPTSIGIIEDDLKFQTHLFDELKKLPFKPSVYKFSSADEFFSFSEIQKLHLVFIDIGLPDKDGISIIPVIQKINPKCKILIITIIQNEEKIFEALKAGASGYILKTDIYNLAETIKQVHESGGIMTPTIAYKVMQYFQNQPTPVEISKSLTNREKDILNQIVDGSNTREIANFFRTSEGTVRNQMKSIYKKLHVTSKVELILKTQEVSKRRF